MRSLVFRKFQVDLVGHLDPFGIVDAVKIEVGSGCLAFDDVDGFGAFG